VNNTNNEVYRSVIKWVVGR